MRNLLLASAILIVTLPGGVRAGPAVAIGDLNGDGLADRASVAMEDGEVTLTISPARGQPVTFRGIAYTMEEPSLGRNAAGSLQLKTSHMGIGRAAFEQTTTIAWRQGAWRVAGVTRGMWDKLDLDAGRSCDLNYLTGRGTISDRRGNHPIRLQHRAVTVQSWDEATHIPQICLTTE